MAFDDNSIGLALTSEDPFPFEVPRRLTSREVLAQTYPKQRYDLECPDCGALLILKDSKFGIFYGCVNWRETQCKGSLSCNRSAKPLGSPANAETRKLRHQAYEAMHTFWDMSKCEYGEIHTLLGVPQDYLRIGFLDKAKCLRIIEAVRHATPKSRYDRF